MSLCCFSLFRSFLVHLGLHFQACWNSWSKSRAGSKKGRCVVRIQLWSWILCWRDLSIKADNNIPAKAFHWHQMITNQLDLSFRLLGWSIGCMEKVPFLAFQVWTHNFAQIWAVYHFNWFQFNFCENKFEGCISFTPSYLFGSLEVNDDRNRTTFQLLAFQTGKGCFTIDHFPSTFNPCSNH